MYAVIRDRNRNVAVRAGDEVRLDLEKSWVPGTEVSFEAVLVGEGADTRVGRPYVPGVRVVGEVAGESKDEKIVVYRWRRRHGFRRKTGHRARRTVVRIREIQTS